jgi:hypothetical protein
MPLDLAAWPCPQAVAAKCIAGAVAKQDDKCCHQSNAANYCKHCQLLRDLDNLARGRHAGEAATLVSTTVMSLGCNCLSSFILMDLGLRTFSGPFDWIFSCPSMVEHAIRDDFVAFLNRSQLTNNGGEFKAGHRLYSPLVSEKKSGAGFGPGRKWQAHRRHVTNGVLFNHHNPASDEGHAYFERTVKRFRHLTRPNPFVLGCANPKLFVLFSLEGGGVDCEALNALFFTLAHVSHVANFKLLVVTMVTPAPPGSPHGLQELRHMRSAANNGTCCMLVYRQVCRGEVFVRNESYLTDLQDHEELSALVLSHVGGAGHCNIAQDPLLRMEGKGGLQVAPSVAPSHAVRRYTDTKYMQDS